MVSDSENPQNSPKKSSDKKRNENKDKSSLISFLVKLTGYVEGENPEKKQTPSGDKGIKKSPEKSAVRKPSSNVSEGNVSDNARKKKEAIPQNPEEDPAIHFINNLKDHERITSLKKKKNTIIKITACVISIILILTGIVFSLGPTQQVASNVIFGERAMFSVFLIFMGFLILAAVFASRLLEGRFLRNIRNDLEIVEGKNQNYGKKNYSDKNQRTNKKNK